MSWTFGEDDYSAAGSSEKECTTFEANGVGFERNDSFAPLGRSASGIRPLFLQIQKHLGTIQKQPKFLKSHIHNLAFCVRNRRDGISASI